MWENNSVLPNIINQLAHEVERLTRNNNSLFDELEETKYKLRNLEKIKYGDDLSKYFDEPSDTDKEVN